MTCKDCKHCSRVNFETNIAKNANYGFYCSFADMRVSSRGKAPSCFTQKSAVRYTLDMIHFYQAKKAAGFQTSFTDDAHWLMNAAINRRAGYLPDPDFSYYYAQPVNGRFPSRYTGNRLSHLENIARNLNTPNLVVRKTELGEWKSLLLKRIPEERFFS